MNFDFMAGSMGRALGEGLLAAARLAVLQEAAFVVITASGGARMQEGALSLMQMPRTTIAIEEVKEAGLPYLVILTDPTTGGVTASFAMLGDIAIAEPGAQIGFAGQRVIEQTIREKLPEGFQKAEYLLEHGMIDMVVHRFELRPTVARIIRLLLQPDLEQDAEQRRRLPEEPPVALIGTGEGGARRRRPAAETAPVTSYGSDLILARLRGLHPKTIDLSLGRIERLLAQLGHPERQLAPVVHIAGTNGKGSTLALLDAMLAAAGRRVQRYISPHLVRFDERFLFAGRPIAEPELADVFGPVRARQSRRADHRVRDHHGGRLRRVRAPQRGCSPARDRARRPARCDQRDRATAADRARADRARPPGVPRRAHRADRVREGGHPQARRARRSSARRRPRRWR